MLFLPHVAKQKMSYSLIWEWLSSFDSGDGVVPLIPLSILSQTNRWKIKQLRRNEHVLYLACFFFSWSLLTESCFAISTRQGCSQPRNDKAKIKGLREIHDILERQGQRTYSPLYSQFIPLLQDFYSKRQVSNNSWFFSCMGKLWPRFGQDSKSVSKYLLSIYYMLSILLGSADTLVTT